MQELKFDPTIDAWRFKIVLPWDSNTKCTFEGCRLTRVDAREAIKALSVAFGGPHPLQTKPNVGKGKAATRRARRRKLPAIRTLKDLARAINGLDNGYQATVQSSWSNTDRRKPRGQRYRTHIGKGRKGLRIKVRSPDGVVVLDHDTSETYRTVREAVELAQKLFPIT